VGELLTRRPPHLALGAFCLFVLGLSCSAAPGPSRNALGATVDSAFLGEFEDDYRGRHTISTTLWVHQPRTRYHIRRWNVAEQYLIAQNDSSNPSAPGQWTRIDWMALPSMPPYTWAFCLSAYSAPTAAAAESTVIARRETPRTGCNGFPFSRMQRFTTSTKR
jgi:hypothetical protein